MTIDLDAVHKAPLFTALDEEASASLRASMDVVKISKGSILFAEGAEGDHLYVIVEGKLKLGTSSGVTTTGYINYGMNFGSTSGSGAGYTNGFNSKSPVAGDVTSGSIIITNLTSNTWTAFGMTAAGATATGYLTAGSIALGGTLDRVRITAANGTDTFDAGSINILYE